MRIAVNGTSQELPAEVESVQDLVSTLALAQEQVAVEHNGAIVRRAAWPKVALADGDVVEIVTLVGGG